MNAVKFLGECWTILCLFLLLRKQSDPFRILCCLLVKTFWFWSFFVNSGSSFFRLPKIVLPFILIIQITLLNDIYESASAKIFLYFYSFVITGFREPVWNKECPSFSSPVVDQRGCVIVFVMALTIAFSALTLLVGCQEEHLDCKNWLMGCWCGYMSGSKVQIVCIWSSWCHYHPKTSSSLVWFKSRLVLPLWYWNTQFVQEKRPLNGCSVVVVTALKSADSSEARLIHSPFH